jgi:HAD superfamily hydrolase (TIGR01459 family)
MTASTPYFPRIIQHAGPLLHGYDVLLCDIWGVLHDGLKAFSASNDALNRFRRAGGTVVLVSNAPMPAAAVARVLDAKGVPRSTYDHIVSSGDLALAHLNAGGFQRIHRMGAMRRDAAFFDALPAPDASLDVADAIACTGLVDDQKETAEDYRACLVGPASRQVPFICANPDLAVHVGTALLPCAGAIATLYAGLGGPVVWTGKPHALAYATALQAAMKIRGSAVSLARVLAIGDAVRTDLAAAQGAGVDALFILSGLHRDEVLHKGAVNEPALHGLLSVAEMPAKAAMLQLAW